MLKKMIREELSKGSKG